ncbi:DNA polymerase III subunit delta [Enterobacteriaceae endosymbiont of Donacia versicolorea]|uniref:DNA polymerase III subunit delta n=1 Tax=Enterobacteriaceae endosymbiont of Donacia versicolorea TaxID=2675788 RepID=UPI0014499498|nr:DNA polymerase III subunit delta [Enterobacteriaceae endosymbiont of Donacia versicolorea]QJC32152.1 DNA polymerase III subunit delta [Enterobacteriaceae endosymbiont of Donacia versicolorea]
MSKILFNTFYKKIYDKKYFCYIIAGDELFFIKKNINLLLYKFLKLKFVKNNVIIVDNNFDWKYVFFKFSTNDFFCKKQIIHLIFLDKNIFIKYIKNLIFLINLTNNNNILIIEIHNNINLYTEKIIKNIINNKFSIFIKCNKLNNIKLVNWINYCFQKFNLPINNNICHLLKNYFSDNLILLNQVIKNISLQKKNSNYSSLLIILNNISNFVLIKESNLINSLLKGDIENSINIIKYMKYTQQNPFLILYQLQKNIFLILKIYRNLKKCSLNTIFKQNKIISIKKIGFFKTSLKKLNYKKLYLIIKLLLEIEINIKSFIINNYIEKYFWIDLERLALLFS